MDLAYIFGGVISVPPYSFDYIEHIVRMVNNLYKTGSKFEPLWSSNTDSSIFVMGQSGEYWSTHIYTDLQKRFSDIYGCPC